MKTSQHTSTHPLALFSRVFAAAGFLCLVACNSSNKSDELTTFETARVEQSINNFKENPTESNLNTAETSLKTMDAEIKELEGRVAEMQGDDRRKAEGKIAELRRQHAEYSGELSKARVDATLSKVGDSVKDAAKSVGDTVKDAAGSVKDTMTSD